MGLSEPSLNTITKPCYVLSHCKVSCDSPCCTKLRGEDNHCMFNIDTHEYVNSDSDEEEHIEKQQLPEELSVGISNNNLMRNVPWQVI